jgi:NADPH:quinone reductase-like Zn-dependent oxidoreductase
LRKIRFAGGRPAEVVRAPDRVPSPGQLLVRTEAVGVSVGLARVLAAGERGESATPGGEVVGTVVALGSDVAGFAVGDRVGGVVFQDAFADLVVADPRLVGPVPAGVDAAASGTGHLAVQLARALGAGRVVGAVGSADKADFVRGCGADEAVTYAQTSWGEPVDMVLDGAGGDLVQRGRSWSGRLRPTHPGNVRRPRASSQPAGFPGAMALIVQAY